MYFVDDNDMTGALVSICRQVGRQVGHVAEEKKEEVRGCREMSILQPLEPIIREAIQDLIFITFLYGFLFIFSFIVFIFGAKIPLDLFLTVFFQIMLLLYRFFLHISLAPPEENDGIYLYSDQKHTA